MDQEKGRSTAQFDLLGRKFDYRALGVLGDVRGLGLRGLAQRSAR